LVGYGRLTLWYPSRFMSRMHLRGLLTVTLLCGAAGPALADGALGYDGRRIAGLFVELLALIAVTAVVMLVIGRSVRSLSNGIRTRAAKPADPVVPTARVVPDRDRSA
jgi:hypothetical protein